MGLRESVLFLKKKQFCKSKRNTAGWGGQLPLDQESNWKKEADQILILSEKPCSASLWLREICLCRSARG